MVRLSLMLESFKQDKETANARLQLGGLCSRFLNQRNIWIGILPECQEILVDSGRFRAIPGSGQRSGQLETRPWSHGIVQHDSRMIENFLKLSHCLAMAAQAGIGEAADEDRIKRPKESSAGVIRGARNGEVVRSGRLRHIER